MLVQNNLAKNEQSKIIKQSSFPWAFPIVVVCKTDGSARFCVDYRRLNDIIGKDAHPLPRIKDIFDALQGS